MATAPLASLTDLALENVAYVVGLIILVGGSIAAKIFLREKVKPAVKSWTNGVENDHDEIENKLDRLIDDVGDMRKDLREDITTLDGRVDKLGTAIYVLHQDDDVNNERLREWVGANDLPTDILDED